MQSYIPSSAPDAQAPSQVLSTTPHPLAKFKQRSHDTHHTIHVPELNLRLGLNLQFSPPAPIDPADAYASFPNLTNTSPVQIVYLGNSQLERLKTTGSSTRLNTLATSSVALNVGVGGDKNENILFRLDQGLHHILKTANEKANKKCDIKLWILCSGTNNLHPKHGFKEKDVQSWKALVDACLDIAPQSIVLACDVFYRKDVPDEVVERANGMLEQVAGQYEHGRVVWVEARERIAKDMLVDHVHLDERGYEVWDEILWPYVEGVRDEDEGNKGPELEVNKVVGGLNQEKDC